MRAQDRYGGRSGQSAPDPTSAGTVDEFVACLRRLKVWAGDPSLEVLRRRSGVPSSTLADAIRVGRRRLPRLDVVRMFVRACGATAEEAAGWESGWRQVRGRLDAATWPAAGGPHQLPGGGSDLVGRQDVLDRLDALHRQRAARRRQALLALVVGAAGVGKTAVALHWAHRTSREYPDGQLYVDLRGAAIRPAITPGDALLLLLDALGVPTGRVSAEIGARAGLFRSLTYSRRLLIVLDNARDAEQVRPLLPGGPECMTLVTSRNRLSALVAGEGGVRVSLAPLRADEAVDLIELMLDDARVQREPAAVRNLTRLCGYLPLALRIAAANLADHPQWTVSDYVAQLTVGNRLRKLALSGDETTAVQAAFDLSYAALDDPTRRVFRRLACVPQPEFTVEDVSALTRQSRVETGCRLEGLVAAHFVEPIGPGRYAIHDLLRLYAANLADVEACGCSGESIASPTTTAGMTATRLCGRRSGGRIPASRRQA